MIEKPYPPSNKDSDADTDAAAELMAGVPESMREDMAKILRRNLGIIEDAASDQAIQKNKPEEGTH